MRSVRRGEGCNETEVVRVEAKGVWLRLDRRELFLSFEEFPWFEDAPVREVFRIERPQLWHLSWPGLDVDLEVESIEHPERFPLKLGVPPKRNGRRGAPRPRA